MIPQVQRPTHLEDAAGTKPREFPARLNQRKKELLRRGQAAHAIEQKANFHATQDVLISTQDAMRLGLVQTGDTAEIRLKAKQGILNDIGATAVNVKGGNTLLEGGDGGIGTLAKFVNTNLADGRTLTARASEGIYLYERIQHEMAEGRDLRNAFYQAMCQRGTAAVFTAVTMSIGVCTWAFAPLKFQADMGVLLAFMFLVNVFGAIFLLPALAAWLNLGRPLVRAGVDTPMPQAPAGRA